MIMLLDKHGVPGGTAAVHAAPKKDKNNTQKKQCVTLQMLVEEGWRISF